MNDIHKKTWHFAMDGTVNASFQEPMAAVAQALDMLHALLVVSSHIRVMDMLARSVVSWLRSARMQPHLMQSHLVRAHRRLIAVPMLYLEPVGWGRDGHRLG